MQDENEKTFEQTIPVVATCQKAIDVFMGPFTGDGQTVRTAKTEAVVAVSAMLLAHLTVDYDNTGAPTLDELLERVRTSPLIAVHAEAAGAVVAERAAALAAAGGEP